MKKKLITAYCLCFVVLAAFAQQKEGKVIYERTSQLQIRFAGLNEEMERQIPQTRTDKFELTFANNQSLWKQAEQENQDDGNFSGGGMQIQMVVAGSDDVLYTNFDVSKKVEEIYY